MEPDDIYDPAFVRDVFDRCSGKYIAFSTFCSLGFSERWRRQCTQMLPSLPDQAKGFDLMAGTGEVWPHLLKAHSGIAKITAVLDKAGLVSNYRKFFFGCASGVWGTKPQENALR